MRSWSLEPGHTAAHFPAVHKMVTWVTGAFKDVHGRVLFDLDEGMATTFEGTIDITKLWTGEPHGDDHSLQRGVGADDPWGDERRFTRHRYLGQWKTP